MGQSYEIFRDGGSWKNVPSTGRHGLFNKEPDCGPKEFSFTKKGDKYRLFVDNLGNFERDIAFNDLTLYELERAIEAMETGDDVGVDKQLDIVCLDNHGYRIGYGGISITVTFAETERLVAAWHAFFGGSGLIHFIFSFSQFIISQILISHKMTMPRDWQHTNRRAFFVSPVLKSTIVANVRNSHIGQEHQFLSADLNLDAPATLKTTETVLSASVGAVPCLHSRPFSGQRLSAVISVDWE